MMIYSSIPLVQTIVELFKLKGVKHIIISPGSRNAPLTIGFTNNPYFTCYSIVDERCAAFFALGIAQKLKEPTAVVCTSGSALLNYYPAVAEAYYSDIPLIVVSADRPKHFVGIGDGQTINQPDVFKNHCLYSANLKLDLNPESNTHTTSSAPIMKSIEMALERFIGIQQDIETYNNNEINKAINLAITNKGPVHINTPLDEPLYNTENTLSAKPINVLPEFTNSSLTLEAQNHCKATWQESAKIMILVGVNAPNSIDEAWLLQLAQDQRVIVCTETTSNLHHPNFFSSIDQLIAPLNAEEELQLAPQLLITFGGLIISKKIKTLLRKYKPKQHWHIDEKQANDTFFCLSHHFKITPNAFFSIILPQLKNVLTSNYLPYWLNIKAQRLEKHKAYVNQIPYSDFKVFNTLIKNLPNHYSLQVGNSSVIRYLQLFQLHNSIEVYCNRGTSGIDGSTSTALGFAVANTKPTLLITGDLSFFYDSNALWNNYIPKNFKIILINNSGGGIFRILPGHKNTENFDTYFETKHQLTAKHLCQMFNFEYLTAQSIDEVTQKLHVFFGDDGPKLLEIFTPRTENDAVLLTYFDFIR